MDLARLLHGIKPLAIHSIEAKADALRLAYSQSLDQLNPQTFAEFVNKLPLEILGFSFGSNAEDHYYSSIFSEISQIAPVDDWLLACILNRAVSQLNFQTRYLGELNGPEIFLLFGEPEYLIPAMSNGNVVIGCATSSDYLSHHRKLTEISNATLSEIKRESLFYRACDDIKGTVMDLNRKIGCIAILNIDEFKRSFDVSMADLISEHTIYVMRGPGSMIHEMSQCFVREYPAADFHIRTYTDRSSNSTKAIMIGSGFNTIPKILHEA